MKKLINKLLRYFGYIPINDKLNYTIIDNSKFNIEKLKYSQEICRADLIQRWDQNQLGFTPDKPITDIILKRSKTEFLNKVEQFIDTKVYDNGIGNLRIDLELMVANKK